MLELKEDTGSNLNIVTHPYSTKASCTWAFSSSCVLKHKIPSSFLHPRSRMCCVQQPIQVNVCMWLYLGEHRLLLHLCLLAHMAFLPKCATFAFREKFCTHTYG